VRVVGLFAALGAERATLWALEEGDEQTLTAMVTEDAAVRTVRVPVGTGIAGTVARDKSVINIADAYEDSRFNKDVDADTGFRTRAMLAFPVMDAAGKVAGVLQVMNKRSSGAAAAGSAADGAAVFSADDVELGEMLSLHVGVALRNVQVFESAVRARTKTDAMLSLVRALHEPSPSAASLMFAITNKTPKIVDADRCTLFMVDRAHEELWAIQGEIDVRFPMGSGIVGDVATSKKSVNIPDAYADSRWGGVSFDKANGYVTKAILTMPLVTQDGEVIGVVQCINKKPSSGHDSFDSEDESVLGTFLGLVAPIIAKSALFKHVKGKSQGEGSEFAGHAIAGDHAAAAAAAAQPAIAEEDEEEEEDEDEEEDAA
jgi:adenylate cyclase